MDKFDLNLLRSLQLLLKTCNVTLAAKAQGVSQSAMSYNLARLRTHFGDELLTRQGGKMVMTPFAHGLQSPLEEVFASLEALTVKDKSLDLAQCHESFVIALPDIAEADFAPGLLALVRREAPNMTLHFNPLGSIDVYDELDSGSIHFAIGAYLEGRVHHKRKLMFYEQFLCLYNPAFFDEILPDELEQWLALPHLVMQESKGEPDPLRRALGKTYKRLKVAATTSRLMLVPHLIKQAPVVSTLPSSIAMRFAQQHGFKVAVPPFKLKEVPIALVWHASFDKSPAHVWLRNTISNSFHPTHG
ncbi:LysR family transcriptional regulator [Cohaesibacter marisflavi]|uniref:LysR family transcriptional regulator n=1 Tax=Cohaesibacter marisflavi TaxID=655353 RepID=UPI0029C999D4|nr:LysR family transcriptional regulator [Cohaesibacter marisflavi]